MDHVSKILHRAWTGATERADVLRALDGLPVPGRVELRSRYLHLRDASAVLPATLGEPLDEARWEEIVRLSTCSARRATSPARTAAVPAWSAPSSRAATR